MAAFDGVAGGGGGGGGGGEEPSSPEAEFDFPSADAERWELEGQLFALYKTMEQLEIYGSFHEGSLGEKEAELQFQKNKLRKRFVLIAGSRWAGQPTLDPSDARNRDIQRWLDQQGCKNAKILESLMYTEAEGREGAAFTAGWWSQLTMDLGKLVETCRDCTFAFDNNDMAQIHNGAYTAFVDYVSLLGTVERNCMHVLRASGNEHKLDVFPVIRARWSMAGHEGHPLLTKEEAASFYSRMQLVQTDVMAVAVRQK